MLYIDQNRTIYYFIEPTVGTAYNLYNLIQMKVTQNSLDLNLYLEEFRGLSKLEIDQELNINLILDFLENIRTDNINYVLDKVIFYFGSKGCELLISESPLKLSINELNINNLVTIISDPEFQMVNQQLENLSSSVWRTEFL
jgi:hypothetical protein